jgi:two-component system sensor histidine kinase DegS
MFDGEQPGRGSDGGRFGRGSDGGQPGRSGDGGPSARGGDGAWRGGGPGTGGLHAPDGSQDSGPLSLQGLLDLVHRDVERLREGLEEVRLFARTNVADLEQANQRKSQAMAHIKEIEDRLETFSRREIRQAYLDANEAGMRVFMMNEQRERMADKQRTYERYLRSYQQIAASLTRLLDEQQALQENAGGSGTLARVVETQEQLRQRIAQHLHDGPAQALANVVLSAEICARAIDHDLAQARKELDNLKNTVNATLQETRKFIFELRPMTLDDLGLIPTLRRYVSDLSNKSKVEVLFGVQGPEQRFPSWLEVSLFRIAQEALSNVILHARASQAALTLVIDTYQLVMTIEDNGVGFDVEAALAQAAEHNTVGLNSMYERAEMLGGRLVVESLPDQGTKIELVLQRSRGESYSSR